MLRWISDGLQSLFFPTNAEVGPVIEKPPASLSEQISEPTKLKIMLFLKEKGLADDLINDMFTLKEPNWYLLEKTSFPPLVVPEEFEDTMFTFHFMTYPAYINDHNRPIELLDYLVYCAQEHETHHQPIGKHPINIKYLETGGVELEICQTIKIDFELKKKCDDFLKVQQEITIAQETLIKKMGVHQKAVIETIDSFADYPNLLSLHIERLEKIITIMQVLGKVNSKETDLAKLRAEYEEILTKFNSFAATPFDVINEEEKSIITEAFQRRLEQLHILHEDRLAKNQLKEQQRLAQQKHTLPKGLLEAVTFRPLSLYPHSPLTLFSRRRTLIPIYVPDTSFESENAAAANISAEDTSRLLFE